MIPDKELQQRMFDKVWQAFVVEGKPRCAIVDADRTSCVYYKPSTGERCAIGVNMTLEEAMALSESKNSRSSIDELHYLGLCPANLRPAGIGFMTALQRAHDHGRNSVVMHSDLIQVARGHDLKVPA